MEEKRAPAASPADVPVAAAFLLALIVVLVDAARLVAGLRGLAGTGPGQVLAALRLTALLGLESLASVVLTTGLEPRPRPLLSAAASLAALLLHLDSALSGSLVDAFLTVLLGASAAAALVAAWRGAG
jgi:hypothetical protein